MASTSACAGFSSPQVLLQPLAAVSAPREVRKSPSAMHFLPTAGLAVRGGRSDDVAAVGRAELKTVRSAHAQDSTAQPPAAGHLAQAVLGMRYFFETACCLSRISR
jgi:hypothetical protein